jgi:hypothetical protein
MFRSVLWNGSLPNALGEAVDVGFLPKRWGALAVCLLTKPIAQLIGALREAGIEGPAAVVVCYEYPFVAPVASHVVLHGADSLP